MDSKALGYVECSLYSLSMPLTFSCRTLKRKTGMSTVEMPELGQRLGISPTSKLPAPRTWSVSPLPSPHRADAPRQVPYDQPVAAHDMLVRFLNIDLLGAAGPAAQVPSRVGNEQEAVLGETHPNGTAVPSFPSSGSTTNPALSSPADALASESALEALVNAGSAVFIIVLMVLAAIAFFCVRKRLRRSAGNVFGSGHSRTTSSGGARGRALPRDDEEANELEELVDRDGGRGGGDYRDDDKGKGVERVIFNLGEEDEEEERKRG